MEKVCLPMRARRTRIAFLLGVWLLAALPLQAQTNPNVVEFRPSAAHSAIRTDGRPVVSRYQLDFYSAGSLTSFLSLDIGKPAPQADGLIRVDYTRLLTAWPYPGQASEVRVAAFGPDGIEVSAPSNSFVYSCSFGVPASQSVPAAGGSSTLAITATSYCSWTARSSAAWLTLSGATGVGPGSVTVIASANSSSSSRTATVTVQDKTITITQAGTASGNLPPIVTLTSPANGATYAVGAAIAMAAAASDTDNGVARVEFFQNNNLIAADASAPYSITWTPPAAGSYSLKAIAYDAVGASGTSAVSVVTVGTATATSNAIGDMTWSSASNGWGPPEKHRSNGEQGPTDGRVLTLNGRTYASGLGVHAGSDVRYALNGVCSTFTADIGLDDEVGSNGSVIFQVVGDGTVLFKSGVLTGSSATQSITANVTGVRSLQLLVTDAGNGNAYDHADWANANLSCSQPLTGASTVSYISDLPWSSVTNGWGPAERDRSNGEQGATDGGPITLNGRAYAKGVGVHAPSELHVPLNGVCTAFQADLGVDDEVTTRGTVTFQVFADGTKLFDSGSMNGSTATKSVSLDVTGKRDLALIVTDSGDGVSHDHADWADARVRCTR